MDYQRLLSNYDYAELRLENGSESTISIKDDEVKNTSGSVHGMGVRILMGGSWGFASGSSGTVEDLLKRAEKLARLSKGKIRISNPSHDRKKITQKAGPRDSEDEIKELLRGSREMKAESIQSRIAVCRNLSVGTEFYNSHGSEIIQETEYSYLSCAAIAKSGDIMQRGSERTWSRTGFGKMDVTGTAEKARDKAIRLVHADPPPKGRFTVVFDHEMTGVFSHEAVGHACEADAIVDKESILADKLGSSIGNELVSIVDDPSADDFGNYEYDDEGTKAAKVTLIDRGKVSGFLNSMETSHELGMKPNGHARAGDYSEVPIVRMSNTYFQKGDQSLEEVFDIRKGIYLKGMKGGSVDTFSGGFMFKAEEAYDIINGEKQKIMRDVTITGTILQTLLDVEAVGNDFGTSPGICGKGGQEVPVSDGGPHIRVKGVVIG